MSLGFVGTFWLNKFLRNSFISRKANIEDRLEIFLNKKVDLGSYSGMRLFGISLANPKVIDKENLYSGIKAKNIYVGVMPIRSLLNQKLIIKIIPNTTEINVDRDFFNRDKIFSKRKNIQRSRINFDLNFKLAKFSDLKLKDLDLETKIKGDLIYKSKNRQLIGNINSKFEEKGNLKVKFNTKLNQDFLKFELNSKGVTFENSQYKLGNKIFVLKKGKFKSNFKFLVDFL